MNQLFLEDLAGLTNEEVIQHIVRDYEADKELVNKFKVLIAYESVGSWGCDSSSWFLLKEKNTGKLFETHGSHCSCHGFEGQFEPEETNLEYLKSERFYFNCGGYDDNADENRKKVKEFISKMRKTKAKE